jgi:5-formyltetrahydrofolate cyclo-ligase
VAYAGPRDMPEAAELALRAQAKAELRTRMRNLRRVTPEAACAARSSAIGQHLLALPELERAHVVIAYAAYKKEANPASALAALRARGVQVGLVRVEPEGQLGLHRVAEGDALIENAFGIEEPSPDAEVIADAAVEVVIVPALAVDARGHRIGYGHGYYDRLLPRLTHAFKLAIAYDFQLLAELPDMPGDATVDCVVTDRRVLRIDPRSDQDA